MGLSLLRSLGPVLGAALVALGDADGVQRSTDDVIANTRKVLHTASANEHDRVLLEVVPDARDIGRDFDAVGETDTRDLAERGVRLLGGRRVNARANAALLRARLQCRRLRLVLDGVTASGNKLVDRWHSLLILLKTRTALTIGPGWENRRTLRRHFGLCQARTEPNDDP